MTAERAHQEVQKIGLQRQPQISTQVAEEIPVRMNFRQANILDLQRLVGNKGVQALLAKGKLSGAAGLQTQRATAQRATIQRSVEENVQRCEDYGEELEEIQSTEPAVQRFWGDDDEGNESQSESSGGGGIWDNVSNAASGAASFVGDTASAAANTAGQLVSDTANQAADTAGKVVNWARDTTNKGIDTVVNWANDTLGGGKSPQATNEAVPPAEITGSGDSITSGDASCVTEEGVGYGTGTGKSLSLHGKTVANYDHGKPYPKTFPSGATVKHYEVNKVKVFDASGNVEATFKASPNITLPPVPSGLTTCQTEAVQTFINGTLAKHEQEHADAFTNNYNGTSSLPFSFKAIPDSKEAEAIQSVIEKEDFSRIATANSASAKLDPWNEPIPGLDCEDE